MSAITSTEHLERFYQFAYERQYMWYKRMVERVPQPWTDDKWLNEYRFTNVLRELDRGTIYARRVVQPGAAAGGQLEVLLRTVVYRTFNKAATYDEVFREHHPLVHFLVPDREDYLKQRFDEVSARQPLYTKAHVVSSYSHISGDASKAHKIADSLIQFNSDIHTDEFKKELGACIGSRQVWSLLQRFPGIGEFVAYEVLSDLAYSPAFNINEDSWAHAGPGARLGIDIIFGKQSGEDAYLEKMKYLREQQGYMFLSLGLPIYLILPPELLHRHFTLRNIEHTLCEYYKYDKLSGGNAQARTYYNLGEGFVWK